MRPSGRRWRALTASALVVGLAAMHPAGARAATDPVNTCNESTLRSVISSAAAGDTVTFGCSGTITLTSGGGGPITLSKNLAIDASGAPGPVTISGGNSVQVFHVNSGVTATLSHLSITGGNAGMTGLGGGIDNEGTLAVTHSILSGNSASAGAGILSTGTLTVMDSTLSGNNAVSNGAPIGGGIYSFEGKLTVTGSTFSGNSADGGAGIYSLDSSVTVTNSTFSGNSAGGGAGIMINTGTLTVTNSTFSGNNARSEGGGGGILASGSVTLANTIVANSTGGNCSGNTITDNGGNLADDNTCGGITQVSTAALNLGPLASNGGPTQTIALGAGSVAIDFTSTNCPSTDQRGVARPDNGEAKCDAGAYEFQDPDSDLGLANVPSNITVNATSAAGAVVTYTAPTAVDEAGDSPAATVSCDHPSGATFSLGVTTVTCTVTDSDDANSPVSAHFTVTVNDADLALGNVPANITVNATNSQGAVVTFTAPTATDEDGTTIPVNCDHASGATFPIGATTVTCTASDSDDTNSPVSASFTVTVADTDLGITNVPANITMNATSPRGATVPYILPSAVDEAGDSPAATVSCDHPSGSTFASGTTTVTCTVTDSDDTPSTVSGSFSVTVKGAAAQLTGLIGVVLADHLEHGQTTSLVSQLQAVLTDLQANNTSQACGDLGAFMNHVRAQSGKKLTTAQADDLLVAATNILHVMGC